MLQTIILDYDGVVAKTFHFHLNKISEFIGREVTEEEYKAMHDGNFYVGERAQDLKDANWLQYRDFVFEEQVKIPIDEEVKDLIREWDANYELYIISSGSEETIRQHMINQGLDVFKEILGLETHHSKKHKFNMLFNDYGVIKDQSLFVTDTLGDLIESNNLNIK